MTISQYSINSASAQRRLYTVRAQVHLSPDLDRVEFASIIQGCDNLLHLDFPSTPTREDVDSFQNQICNFENRQDAFIRTITASNRKLCKEYKDLPLESRREGKIEHYLDGSSRSLKELIRKG